MQSFRIILVVLPFLGACASWSPSTADSDRQDQRLAGLTVARSYDAALSELRARSAQPPAAESRRLGSFVAAAPAPQGQERKIDQVEPKGIGRRPYFGAGTPLRVLVEVGAGEIEVKAPRTTLDDSVDAYHLRIGVDGAATSPVGAALHIRAFTTDDDLFAGALMNNGVVPANADTTAHGVQVFPHLRLEAEFEEVALTVRVGAILDYTAFEHEMARVDRSWVTIGSRVEAEPVLPLFGSEANGLDLFGRVAADLGYGWFREQYANGDDGDHMHRWSYDLGAGLRFRRGAWSLDVGYEYGQSRMGGTDTALFGDRSAVKFESQQLFVGGSIQF